jgi:hypothetical protein
MVTSTEVQFPDQEACAPRSTASRARTRTSTSTPRPGQTLFDDHMAANMLVLGAAYQAGAIP